MRREVVIIISFLMISTGFISGCVEENKSPLAKILANPLSGFAPLTVIFNASLSTDEDGKIVNYSWDFGDGEKGYGINTSHIFTDTGVYTIKLVVLDDKGKSDSKSVTITVQTPSLFSLEQAIDLLMNNIINPGSSNNRISAFMLSQPLQNGDVVTSESEDEYNISNNSWFVFIDDDPEAEFAHDTRYLFIDEKTGDYNIYNNTWPPLINNISLFDPDNLSRGNLIEFYPVLNYSEPVVNISGDVDDSSISGDYGDAPDNRDAYYGVTGRFPTFYNTTNSLFGRPGGHTRITGEETLGLLVSAEVDANDPNDPDGIPNLVDSDRDDRLFVMVNAHNARLYFTVKVSQNAPDVTRYVNILIDFDQNGNWTTGSHGIEWVVKNQEVDVKPGMAKTIMTPTFSWSNKTIHPSPVWARVALTREKINYTLFSNVGGWDGSGQFDYGEIEDTLIFLDDTPPEPDYVLWREWWPPLPKLPPNGQPKKGGGPKDPPKPDPISPQTGPCGTPISYHYIVINCGDNQKSTHMKGECDQLNDVFNDLGCTSLGYLGPDKGGGNANSKNNIKSALEKIRDNVKCLDRVFDLIKGHGNGNSISLYNSNGNKRGSITFSDISTWLDIPACKDQDCTDTKVCCYVNIIISSCYAGKALKNDSKGGLTREGRTVAVSSTTGKSYGGNGGYTAGFVKGMRETGSVSEAHKAGNDNQKKKHPSSETGFNPNECPCKCPCSPNITGDKWVLDLEGYWVEGTDALFDQIMEFQIEIENTGKCRNVTDLQVVDIVPLGLSYGNDAELFYNGISMGARPPCTMVELESGLELTWNLNEIPLFSRAPTTPT